MAEVLIDADIILQMQVHKVAEVTNTSTDQLVAVALEKFLREEGYNNLAPGKDISAA